MKKLYVLLMVCGWLVYGTTASVANMSPVADWRPANPDKPVVPVSILVVGDVDEALVTRARDWTESNLAIPVPMLEARPDVQLPTFDDVAAFASAYVSENNVGVVVLWMPSSDIMNHGAHFPEQRVVVANIKPMISGDDLDDEKIGRRVERQAIRGVCILMGLEPSPVPQSAMFAYSTREELDQIGRNLDPPWQIRLQRRAEQLGIRVDPENPQNMIGLKADE